MADGTSVRINWDRISVVCLVVGALIGGFYMGRSTVTAAGSGPATGGSVMSRLALTQPIGQRISLAGVDWQKNRRTLVMALQTSCHYCRESAPFYEKLTHNRQHFGDTKIIAVLPQSVQDSTQYLSTLDVKVDEVFQASGGEIPIRGTPTLLLVNDSGFITEAWAGKLSPDAETEVVARLTVK